MYDRQSPNGAEQDLGHGLSEIGAQDDSEAALSDPKTLRRLLEARDREMERLRETFQSEREHLQAQLDTANAMWAYYARDGKAPDLVQGNQPLVSGDARDQRAVVREARALAEYAIKLEAKYIALLQSRSWRLLSPVRVVIRAFRRFVLRRSAKRSQWPRRPNLLAGAAPERGCGSKSIRGAIEAQSARELERQTRELRRYALALEAKIHALLGAATWKAAAPVRLMLRGYRRKVLRKPVGRTRLPKRPQVLEEKG